MRRPERIDPLRALLFRLEPERAHRLTLGLLQLAGAIPALRSGLRRIFSFAHASLEVEALGLEFANPIGLAAGYDKNGVAMHGMAALGFGHLEVGTVTPRTQPGNPRPRVFRLEQDQALINRLGFPNDGAQRLSERLKRRPRDVVVGVNIGKSADTPLERASEDYRILVRKLYAEADYLAINVSSPNTIGLRQLQGRRYLEELLASISKTCEELAEAKDRWVPILIKLAPDLSREELEDTVAVVLEAELDGIIATNTTTERDGLQARDRQQAGGLSGRPLKQRSTEIVRQIRELGGEKLAVIGVGGISGPEDVEEKLEAGADLVQLYTGLVYRGPGLVKQILASLAKSGG